MIVASGRKQSLNIGYNNLQVAHRFNGRPIYLVGLPWKICEDCFHTLLHRKKNDLGISPQAVDFIGGPTRT